MEDKIAKIIYSELHNSEIFPWEQLQFTEQEVFMKIARQIVKEIKQGLIDMVEIDFEGLHDLFCDLSFRGVETPKCGWTKICEFIADHKSQILKLKEEK